MSIVAQLDRVAAAVGGVATVPVAFAGIATDSRQVMAGNLFFALRGPNHDGHDHVAAAVAAGAAAVVVERPLPLAVAQWQVSDSLAALTALASWWRRQCRPQMVAITGSNGKTSVKELTAKILGQVAPTLATAGNLNNHYGVPRMLLRLAPEHHFAVLEMGANHAGEIAHLVSLAAPQVALVNNAGPAHLEGFGSLQGVAAAKGEIYSGLPPDGIAIINSDDTFADFWRRLAGDRRIITFGLQAGADITATWQPQGRGSDLVMQIAGHEVACHLPLAGRHSVMNGLAAAAAACALGIDANRIASGLALAEPVAGRLEWLRGVAGATVINDSYNANPASLQAGLAVLSECRGRRLLVLGDMAELGSDAVAIHATVGAMARRFAIDGLYCVGELSAAAATSFGAGGHHFASQNALLAALKQELDADTTLLVKGSRSSRMDGLVEQLKMGDGGAR
jgi:UDP-N-acetylmuramoyl-tripeptide--D-alanyl-D-alanine ligase